VWEFNSHRLRQPPAKTWRHHTIRYGEALHPGPTVAQIQTELSGVLGSLSGVLSPAPPPSSSLVVVSFNVQSSQTHLRALLQSSTPDLLLLQETRASDERLAGWKKLAGSFGYWGYWSEADGVWPHRRGGVAVLFKFGQMCTLLQTSSHTLVCTSLVQTANIFVLPLYTFPQAKHRISRWSVCTWSTAQQSRLSDISSPGLSEEI
jgi:hypothetical protein